MFKKTKNHAFRNRTSYHRVGLWCTPKDLIKLLGAPTFNYNGQSGKTNMEWLCEYIDSCGNARYCTIYDYKFKINLKNDDLVFWHIGTKDLNSSLEAKVALANELIKHCGEYYTNSRLLKLSGLNTTVARKLRSTKRDLKITHLHIVDMWDGSEEPYQIFITLETSKDPNTTDPVTIFEDRFKPGSVVLCVKDRLETFNKTYGYFYWK